jgi:hypothetical protein
MEIAAYHPSGICNFEMASGLFLKILCTPVLLLLGLLLYAYLLISFVFYDAEIIQDSPKVA